MDYIGLSSRDKTSRSTGAQVASITQGREGLRFGIRKEKKMTISLKVAARRFLRWNQKGCEFAQPRRGIWIERSEATGKCVACKIGLVMIGRYGISKAVDSENGREHTSLMRATLNYGPNIDCPISDCWHVKRSFGVVVEHLFEKHKWSVNKIDKWLAELSEDTGDAPE